VLSPDIASQIHFDAAGLVPVVVQDRESGTVLMMAWADAAAVANTLATRRGTYFSRSRNEQWMKGETSGSFQHVHEVRIDCDGDTLLYVVDQVGAACHNGTRSCFDTASLLAAPDA
jgi:phosphoribosyl-AMP cyclohydrolase